VLYVVHELRPIISCHRFHPDTGETEQPFQIVNGEHFAGPSEAALAISSRGDFLYSARASERTVTAWAIDSASGALLRHDSRRDVSSSICALHAAPSSLYSLCKGSDAIVQLSIDSMNGKFGEAARVALVKSPRAIVMI
jgi:6-phosphogluconolactonase (cycloisomerase 2 family)